MALVRNLTAQLRVDGTRLPGELKKADRHFKRAGRRWRRQALGTMGRGLKQFERAAKATFGRIKKLAKFGASVAGVGLAAGLGFAAREAGRFEEGLIRLQLQSNRTTAQMAGLRQSIDRVSRATGVSRGDVLGAASQYVTLTGDIKGAEQAVETFAKVAVAAGAPVDQIASTAAALQQNLKIDPRDFEKAFSIILAGGKAGAIELSDLSSMLADVTPGFSRFGKVGAEGMAELGAMLQLTRQGFGSAAESVTGLKSLMNGLTRNAKRFENQQIKIFKRDSKGNKTSQMRNLADILADIKSSKIGENSTKLIKLFGRTEGFKAFEQITKVPGALDELIAKTRQADDVGRDYMEYQNSAAGRYKRAVNNIKLGMAQIFTAENVAKMVSWFQTAIDKADSLFATLKDIKNLFTGAIPDQDGNRGLTPGIGVNEDTMDIVKASPDVGQHKSVQFSRRVNRVFGVEKSGGDMGFQFELMRMAQQRKRELGIAPNGLLPAPQRARQQSSALGGAGSASDPREGPRLDKRQMTDAVKDALGSVVIRTKSADSPLVSPARVSP